MGRFSDSPYFLLNGFFEGLSNTKPIEKPVYDFKWGVTFVSSWNVDETTGDRRFSDEPNTFDTEANGKDIVFTDYRTNVWNCEIHYDGNIVQTFNSYIVAPLINISGKGGGIMDLFVKEEDEGYQPITVRYDHTDGNEFHFINSGVKEYEPGENITDIISGRRFLFTFWDKVAVDTFNLFENDREAYFRKDSLYHDFLRIYAKDMMLDEMGVELDIRNYVNTDKLFSFFHRIYKSHDGTKARIIFDGMKDYVMRAVPEHQRTERFTELCNIFFDQLYQEIFDLLKNIWSLIDPMEVDDRYLGYLSSYYDMFDVDVEGATLLHVREFIRDMVWMIKRKGTYTEFYILWRILTATKNMLSVYERWHRKDVENFPDWPKGTISPPCTGTWPEFPYYWEDSNGTTNVPPSAYTDVLYVYRPEYESPTISGGAGEGWYRKRYPNVWETEYMAPSAIHCPSGAFYDTPLDPEGDNLMLSTAYILETDISSEPLAPNAIMTKAIWDQTIDYWEYIRPVNRVATYRVVEAPIADISGKYKHLYEVTGKSSAFLKTKSGITFDLVDGGYIHDQPTSSIKWQIHHNLGENILLQVFDEELNEIVPEEIEYGPSVAVLTFQTANAGIAIMRRSDWAQTKPLPVLDEIWRIFHLRLQKEVIIHYKLDANKQYASTELIDPALALGEFADREQHTAMVGTGTKIYVNSNSETVWNVPHDTGIKGVLMSVYTNDNERVHPSKYTLVDSDNCIIEFGEPTSGYCVFVEVGDLSIEDLIEELEGRVTETSWIAYAHDHDNNDERYEVGMGSYTITYSDNNYYYFDLILDRADTYIINEIELLDKNGDMILHSLMSDLYKPPGVDMTIHYRLEMPRG